MSKLGTFEGVFLPTSLNVLSILMFLRFGFIIGQMGILGTFFLLILSYSIDILTTMSISAISTNGTVKGGGAYYMISRSLGPEFGGAIGIIFFIGQILNSSLNVVGFIEPLLVNFGELEGVLAKVLPVGYFWQLLYSTVLLLICTGVAVIGSLLVSKTAFLLFVILTLSTLSIPLSSLVVKPFYPLPPPFDDLRYTGLSWATFTENLLPQFTSGAAGSVLPKGEPETFRNLFGIFFPATAGIFAGASMSGELKKPSKSIPEGTLKGLLVTFILYSLVIISMGCSIPREILHADIKVIQTVNLLGIVIIMGEFSTSLFSVIMGIVGAASMLNAIADDRIIPGLGIFTTMKKSAKDQDKAKVLAVIATWFIAQIFLFADINQIATFITMAFLMTFIVTNVACFLLRVGSAPNFRPSFKYFSSRTAFTGALACFYAMFIVDGLSATLIIFCLMFLILMIHYLTPPLKFGDISQLLIYHQVRKYLLRLKLQMNVKYWRPQILILVDDPRSSWNLIGFCNHLKKGGLYILGHVVLMNDDTLVGSNNAANSEVFTPTTYKEVQKQKQAWIKLRDMLKIKAFVQIALGPTLPWGVRNVYLGSGLGGMRPNITVLGFYDFKKHGVTLPVVPSFESKSSLAELPTDECRKERKVSISQWVQIVEDLIVLQATVAVAANFGDLDLPKTDESHHHFWAKPKVTGSTKKYIDLYPIQMSSINILEDGQSVLSTNFDTYTLILQLGAILSTVTEWKFSSHILRVIAFVENMNEVEEERGRLVELLSNLRIDAEIKIVSLDDGSLNSYNFIIKGYSRTIHNKLEFDKVDKSLKDEQWWKNLVNARNTLKDLEKQKLQRRQQKSQLARNINSSSKLSIAGQDKKFTPLNFSVSSTSPITKGNFKNNRRYTLSNLQEQGVSLSLNMNTQLGQRFFDYDEAIDSSDSSDSEKESDINESSSLVQQSYGSVDEEAPSPMAKSTSRVDETKEVKPFKNFLKLKEDALADSSGYRSSDQLSIRSSVSNLRPNFLSVKIPQAQINDDENDEDDDTRPTIRFVDDDDEEEEDGDNEEDDQEIDPKTKILQKTPKSKESVFERKSSEKEKDYFNFKNPVKSASSKKSTEKLLKSPSIITNNDEIIQQMRTPQFLAAEDSEEEIEEIAISSNALKPDYSLSKPSSGPVNSRNQFYKKKSRMADHDDKSITQKQLQEELKHLSFNDIPAKGQHLILNELMKLISSKDKTDVIFSTLPAPSLGTHLDDNGSFEYTNNLAVWLDDLPPILLLNSQTVTVTTAL